MWFLVIIFVLSGGVELMEGGFQSYDDCRAKGEQWLKVLKPNDYKYICYEEQVIADVDQVQKLPGVLSETRRSDSNLSLVLL